MPAVEPVRPAVIDDVVRRVVETADPDRIVLFGSAARGEMHARSDLDLLLIKDGEYDYHRLLSALYRTLAQVEPEVDLVLITSAQAERYRNSPCLVIHPALREGRGIYERAAVRS
jgi:predicted nucleotidyltransferase